MQLYSLNVGPIDLERPWNLLLNSRDDLKKDKLLVSLHSFFSMKVLTQQELYKCVALKVTQEILWRNPYTRSATTSNINLQVQQTFLQSSVCRINSRNVPCWSSEKYFRLKSEIILCSIFESSSRVMVPCATTRSKYFLSSLTTSPAITTY